MRLVRQIAVRTVHGAGVASSVKMCTPTFMTLYQLLQSLKRRNEVRMHGAEFHSPYASMACTCIHHRRTSVNPCTQQQLRTIRQVSWDVTPTSLGWRSSTGNTTVATTSHPRVPASTTEQLRKPQIPQNQ
jgi:hypothetical protein